MDYEGDALSADSVAYVSAWMKEAQQASYLPGVYCFSRIADSLRTEVLKTWPAGKQVEEPRFWIGGRGIGFDLASSQPTDSGFAVASIWQGSFNRSVTFGGQTLLIDEDVALMPSKTQPQDATAANPR